MSVTMTMPRMAKSRRAPGLLSRRWARAGLVKHDGLPGERAVVMAQ